MADDFALYSLTMCLCGHPSQARSMKRHKKRLRLIHDFSEVQAILSDRDWTMAGPVQRTSGLLLGEGVIMATGYRHRDLRRQLGQMPMPDLAAIVDVFTPPAGPCNLGEANDHLGRAGHRCHVWRPGCFRRGAGQLVRKCVALAPFRLLGLAARLVVAAPAQSPASWPTRTPMGAR